MNKTKTFFRNTSILFEFLPGYFKRLFMHSLKKKRSWFKISKSPKNRMYMSFILCLFFIMQGKIFLGIIFFILYIVFWLLKIWEGGEPIKWYKDKYLVE